MGTPEALIAEVVTTASRRRPLTDTGPGPGYSRTHVRYRIGLGPRSRRRPIGGGHPRGRPARDHGRGGHRQDEDAHVTGGVVARARRPGRTHLAVDVHPASGRRHAGPGGPPGRDGAGYPAPPWRDLPRRGASVRGRPRGVPGPLRSVHGARSRRRRRRDGPDARAVRVVGHRHSHAPVAHARRCLLTVRQHPAPTRRRGRRGLPVV